MAKRQGRNTKQKIVNTAWRLFYEQGYENTTVDEIVYESGTSKGSFYHYFESKDALLGSLSFFTMNHELFDMIDATVPIDLLARLLSSQLVMHGEKNLLDRKRIYFRMLKQTVREGQNRGEIRTDLTANQIVNDYAMFERALLYDWCLVDGEYSLRQNADRLMVSFLSNYAAKED